MARGAKTGGRKPGTPNKVTADVKALAQPHGPAAIAELVRIMHESESDPARVSAVKELLDRAYGKATNIIDVGGALADFAAELIAAKERLRQRDG